MLVLNSERGELPASTAFESGLREGLANQSGTIEIYVEDIDHGRFPARKYDAEMTRHLRERYAGRRLDVVVPLFDSAFELALAHRSKLFDGVPIIAAGIDQSRLQGRTLPAGVLALPTTYDYRRTAELMLALWPQTREVVIVHGVSDYDTRRRDEALRALDGFLPSLSVRTLGGLPLSRIEEQVRGLPATSAVLIVSMVRDAEGKAYMGRDVAGRLAAVSPVPIFGTFESHIERGTAGGAITDYKAIGRDTAAVIEKVIAGTFAAGGGAIEPAAASLRVNWRALKHWNIPEERVPSDAQVLFRPPSLWEQHSATIVAIGIALLLQTVLIFMLGIELSRRRRAERTLRESEARFRNMADTAPVMIWMSRPDKGCTFFNKGWLQFTGRSLEQELGEGWVQGIHPYDRERCLAVYDGAFDARKEFSMEYRLRRHDGEYRWVRDDGVPRYAPDGRFVGYIGSCVDITDRRRLEERLRLAVYALPAAVIMVNRDGTIVLANAQAEKLFGYASGELADCPVERLIPERLRGGHPERRAEFYGNPQSRAMAPGRELHARRKDGSEFVAVIGLSPIESEDGMLVLAAVADMTEHYELQQSRQELAHITRISAMGELAGSLAHELNQPLTAVVSNVHAAERFMAAETIDRAELREILNDVAQEANRASDIIRGMRTLVRKGELEAVPLDPGAVVREVAALVGSDAIMRGARIDLEVAPGLPAVRGDRVQLQQVVLNLLLNAFDAMKECPRGERVVAVRVAADGAAGVRIAVSDCGTGLGRDQLERMFVPFFTTKREGLGLGLSISRSIVEAHGAHLRARNNPDRGATFHFTLPLAEAARTVQAAPAGEQA